MQPMYAYMLSFFILFLTATIPSGAMKSIKTPWYKCIRTELTPPNYVFPIVWTILYFLLAIVLAQIFIREDDEHDLLSGSILVWIFLINLALNIIWSFVYFYYKHQPLAYAILLAIIGTALTIIYHLYKLKYPLWTVYSMLLYYVWLCFALILSTLSLYKNC